ncbi:MAG: hypothetical protein J5970_05070 [Bacilli bacterium]|nr:hypothetical protein [Bacilli bacterium]
MCQNESLLVFIFILKIIVLVFLPIVLVFFNDRIEKRYIAPILNINIILVLSLIVLRLFNNGCIVNSSLTKLLINRYKKGEITLKEETGSNVIEKIVTNKKYNTKSGKIVYYFNNVELPISEYEIPCKKSHGYMKNYGNNITAISTFVSTYLERNIDPIEILNYAKKSELIRCDVGIKTYSLLNIIAKDFGYNVKTISFNEVNNYLNSGNVVLAEVTNKPGIRNITCDKSYIVLYNITNDNNYMFLNPSDRSFDYICPSSSAGYGSVVEANTNDYFIPQSDLYSIGLDYIVLERE